MQKNLTIFTRNREVVQLTIDMDQIGKCDGKGWLKDAYLPHKDICGEIQQILTGINAWMRVLFPGGPELEVALTYNHSRKYSIRVSEVVPITIHEEVVCEC